MALHRAHAQSETFLQVFRKSSKFSEVNSVCAQLKASPLVGVFQAGYRGQPAGARRRRATRRPPRSRRCRAWSRSRARSRGPRPSRCTRLERRVTFLATTASVTPFVGLFGTVWGIMNAFGDIGRMGSANLAVVAPGISEALITTAMGLVAAIPAAVFYNFFSAASRCSAR